MYSFFGRALRHAGRSMSTGAVVGGVDAEVGIAKHRNVMNLFDKRPVVAAGGFVAPNASVIGDVLLLDRVSIWYGAVVRGDASKIRIGTLSHIQDKAVIRAVSKLDSGYPADCEIGDQCIIGSGSVITSSVIGDTVNVGAGCIIQEGCDIGSGVILAPGSLVPPGTIIPDGQFWAGNPATFQRMVSAEEEKSTERSANDAYELSQDHLAEFLPYGTAYQHAEAVGKL